MISATPVRVWGSGTLRESLDTCAEETDYVRLAEAPRFIARCVRDQDDYENVFAKDTLGHAKGEVCPSNDDARSGIKVLYTSGYADNAIVHQGRLDPGVLLLTKPHRKSQLANMIRRALQGGAA